MSEFSNDMYDHAAKIEEARQREDLTEPDWDLLQRYAMGYSPQAEPLNEDDPSRTEHDPVNHPQHYTSHPSGVECIQITEHMGFCLGNAVKYIWRADLKGGIEDLEKAAWYINREIERRRKEAQQQADAGYEYARFIPTGPEGSDVQEG